MRFCIDQDTGECISGWVVLDNPSAIPELNVVVPGRPDVLVRATIDRPGIRELGLHSTGLVGFAIDSSLLPDIESLGEIEIRESESGTLIYKRFDIEKHLARRVYYCDPSVMPQTKVTQFQSRNFALNYQFVDRHSAETLNYILNQNSQSLFCSGRLPLSRYLQVLRDSKFATTAILREPFEDFAETILFLKLVANSRNRPSLEEYAKGYESLIDAAATFPMDDADAQKRFFRGLNEHQRAALANPVTRLFGCDPGELPAQRNVGVALENLSKLDWIGTRPRLPQYRDVLTEIIGADILPPGGFEYFAAVENLARSLSRVGPVVQLLELDLTLYSFAEEALDEALGPRA